MDTVRRHGKLLLVVLPLGFGILLTGCGSSTPPSQPSPGTPPVASPIGVAPGTPPVASPIAVNPEKPPSIIIKDPIIIINPDDPITGRPGTGTASSIGTGSGSSTDTGIASSTGSGSGSSTDTGTGSGSGSSTGTGSGSSTDTSTGSSTGTGTGTGQAALTPEQKAAQEQARIDCVSLEAQLQQLVGKIKPPIILPKGLSPEQIAQKIADIRNAVPKEIIALQDALKKFLEENDANAWEAAKKRAREFIRKNTPTTTHDGPLFPGYN